MNRRIGGLLLAGGWIAFLAGCGSSGSGTPPPPTTYVLTVKSVDPASGVSIQASPADKSGTTTGSTSFTLTYDTGTAVKLTAPSSASSNDFSAWSGCTTASTTTCNVTLSANTTVTATYTTPVAPTVTVTPASLSITTAQSLSVDIAVAGPSGSATPTGSVMLSSGAYASSATTLSSGSATIDIPANSLAVGSDTLTGTYTPDSASSATYTTATGTSSPVTVTTATTQPTAITVDQSSSGPAISDELLGMNMAAWYDPTTTGIVPAFQTGGIQALRWPGGSWSDIYHWQNNTACGTTPNGNATFANFANDLAIAGNFDVALTADYGTNAACNGPGDPTEAAAWVTEAETLKVNVTHVTVGNEEYGSWETDMHAKPNDAATYATAAASGYYPDIKAADSSVLVGVSVNPGNSPPWDPTVLANAKYDFVEYHFYPQAPFQESDTYITHQAAQDLTTGINTIKAELATAGHPSTPIYVGEIGSVYTNPGKQSMSITQGLYAGQVLGELMNDGVSRATWWIGFGNCNGTNGNDSSSLYGWQDFGAYNVFADGPSDPDCAGAGPLGTLSPTARAFELFSKVAVNGESVLTAAVAGDTTDVRAYAATNNGGTALFLFNVNETTSQPVTITLSKQTTTSSVTVETYSKSIYDQTNAATPVWAAPTTSTVTHPTLPLSLTLDPWSMNVVIIK